MNFIEEYKKFIVCMMMVIFLVALQSVTGQDTTPWISNLLDGMLALFAGAAVRFSVLKTSEREVLKNNLPAKDDDDPPESNGWNNDIVSIR